jgi:type IV pilus biogenesis protein CpaD/CtpE
MKNTITINTCRTALAALVAGILTGCAATRPIGDVALGAGGAYLGYELSHGNPLATAAGAAGGVIVNEGLHFAAKKQSDKAFAAGYDKGKSDAVKQQYWLSVAMQQPRNHAGSVRLYPVQLPEQSIDGVTFQPTTKLLRIEE